MIHGETSQRRWGGAWHTKKSQQQLYMCKCHFKTVFALFCKKKVQIFNSYTNRKNSTFVLNSLLKLNKKNYTYNFRLYCIRDAKISNTVNCLFLPSKMLIVPKATRKSGVFHHPRPSGVPPPPPSQVWVGPTLCVGSSGPIEPDISSYYSGLPILRPTPRVSF